MTRRNTLAALVAGLGLLLVAPQPAAADGANVARFLANNSLRVKAKPRTRFDRAFGKLRSAVRAKSAVRLKQPVVVLSQTKRSTIAGPANGLRQTSMTAKRELLFDGKRAYLRLTTQSEGLRPTKTTSVVRVPTGKLFGWYGKKLLQAQFPQLTARQVERGLTKLQGKAPRQGVMQRINAFLNESYAAFGRPIVR